MSLPGVWGRRPHRPPVSDQLLVREAALPAGEICDDVAVAAQDILVGAQTLQAHRAARMDLAGGNAHLRAKAVAETVRKVLGDGVQILDGGAGTARQTQRLLAEKGWLREGTGSVTMENSTGKQALLDLGMELLHG